MKGRIPVWIANDSAWINVNDTVRFEPPDEIARHKHHWPAPQNLIHVLREYPAPRRGVRGLSMKRKQGKRHSPEQIIRKLREADTILAAGQTIGQVVQALAISEQKFQHAVNVIFGPLLILFLSSDRVARPSFGHESRQFFRHHTHSRFSNFGGELSSKKNRISKTRVQAQIRAENGPDSNTPK